MFLKVFLATAIVATGLSAKYGYSVSKISKKVANRMVKGGSFHKGCPVPLRDLRYLRIKYIGFDGREHLGEMVVHRKLAKEVGSIFGELYRIKYPIRKMRLVSDYKGNDWLSIENDNTSAFNCRNVTGGKRWSKHSFGKAIDINPIENPYIKPNGKIAHKASYKYKVRRHKNLKNPADRAMIIKGDRALKAFTKRGWFWGKYFKEARDLQHFDKR